MDTKRTPDQLRDAQAALRRPGTRVSALCASLGITRQTLQNYLDAKGRLRPSGERLLASEQAAEARLPLSASVPDAPSVLGQAASVA